MGIRDKILEKTYQQLLKLLHPKSKAFSLHFPKADVKHPLSNTEKRALGPSGAVLEDVQMGSFPIQEYTGLTRLPAVFVANGTEPEETSARNAVLGSANLDSVFEVYPLTLRVVVHQEAEPKYEDSNPVRLAHIREQLDYFLDMQAFGGIVDRRYGYNTPSRVYRALITTTQSLKGIAAPWEIVDFDFVVIFQRQYARD